MLTNPENSSQSADISQSPPAAGDGGDSPSQLLGAFIHYLRARPTGGDSESTGFDDSSSELEGVTRAMSELGGIPAATLQPQVGQPDRTVLYFHGGGYVSGSPPERYLPLAAAVALAANARVHVVDYRVAPETPFPGAFDDCLRAYHWLVTHSGADPQRPAVLGDSAGGNLAVAVTAAARDQGWALPGRIALISPLADLTFSGASIEERKHLDPLVTREMLEFTVTDYLAGSDPATPGALRSSRTCTAFPRCSSRSARTKSSTTMRPASEMRPPPQVSTWPSSRGDMESTSGRYLSLPGCPNPPPRSNAWQLSSKPKRHIEHRKRRGDRAARQRHSPRQEFETTIAARRRALSGAETLSGISRNRNVKRQPTSYTSTGASCQD
jgi:acetyl esterase/lipase